MTDRPNLINEPNPWHRPEAYRVDPAQLIREREDLRVSQLRLRIHPPIDWVGIACIAIAVFAGSWFLAAVVSGMGQ